MAGPISFKSDDWEKRENRKPLCAMHKAWRMDVSPGHIYSFFNGTSSLCFRRISGARLRIVDKREPSSAGSSLCDMTRRAAPTVSTLSLKMTCIQPERVKSVDLAILKACDRSQVNDWVARLSSAAPSGPKQRPGCRSALFLRRSCASSHRYRHQHRRPVRRRWSHPSCCGLNKLSLHT
jgi:hypothetical protein